MKYSLNWLRDFVDIPDGVSPAELAEKITLSVAEVEEVIDQKAAFEGMVVGQIAKIEDHPNADKLKVCRVDVGEGDLSQIICGGENIYEGMQVAVALQGAQVRWHGEGDLITLEKAKIRGEESNGMICASAEIGLAESSAQQAEGEKGVMDLKLSDATPGTPLAVALELEDVVFDVENKSITHRPDLWGHYGMAREIAAFYDLELKNPELYDGQAAAADTGTVKIAIDDNELCSRFVGCIVDGISVGESPVWMQSRLRAIGQRPINSLVDISNYIMFELGEPTHAYDLQKLRGDNPELNIVVRTAKEGSAFVTLDGQDRELGSDMLMVTDGTRDVAVAGVMGGENTMVDEKTGAIFFEAANFNADSVRATSLALGLRTEGSARWEKRLDPVLAERGMRRALHLIGQLYEGVTIGAIVDTGAPAGDALAVSVGHAFLEQKIGVSLERDQVQGILTRLGFGVEVSGDEYAVTVPSWRATGDIDSAEDVVEEVARIYGYNQIPHVLPEIGMSSGIAEPEVVLERRLHEELSARTSLQEVHTYPFVSSDEIELWGGHAQEAIRLANPPSEEQPYLRQSMVPSLWKMVMNNARWMDAFGVYEIGSVFSSDKGELLSAPESGAMPAQEKRLCSMIFGADVFGELKGILQHLLEATGKTYEFVQKDLPGYLAAGTGLAVHVDGERVGYMGILGTSELSKLKTNGQVGVLDIALGALVETGENVVKYSRLPEYPATKRDLAVVVSESVTYADVVGFFAKQELIESAHLFDIFRDSKLGDSKKSMAFHLVFRSEEGTLTDAQVDEVMTTLVKQLSEELGATIRN